eukprot:SAG31_NODE_5454_length_2529_cov_1.725926_2_plen_214_part_00
MRRGRAPCHLRDSRRGAGRVAADGWEVWPRSQLRLRIVRAGGGCHSCNKGGGWQRSGPRPALRSTRDAVRNYSRGVLTEFKGRKLRVNLARSPGERGGEGCYFLVSVQLFEKYGTLIERNTALIEKVSPCRGALAGVNGGCSRRGCPLRGRLAIGCYGAELGGELATVFSTTSNRALTVGWLYRRRPRLTNSPDEPTTGTFLLTRRLGKPQHL